MILLLLCLCRITLPSGPTKANVEEIKNEKENADPNIFSVCYKLLLVGRGERKVAGSGSSQKLERPCPTGNSYFWYQRLLWEFSETDRSLKTCSKDSQKLLKTTIYKVMVYCSERTQNTVRGDTEHPACPQNVWLLNFELFRWMLRPHYKILLYSL